MGRQLRYNTPLSGDSDVQAVAFARNRNDHHWASVTFFDESSGSWGWRPASQLPEHPRYPDQKLKRLYEAQLQNRPGARGVRAPRAEDPQPGSSVMPRSRRAFS